MNTAIKVLSLSTALFAASTIYLAVELHRRGDAAGSPANRPGSTEQLTVAAPQPPAAGSGSGSGSGNPGSSHAPGAASAELASVDLQKSAAPPSDTRQSREEGDASLVFARQFLARYDDSAQRAVLLDEARAAVRRQYSLLKERLKLDDATFDQLVTLLAEQNLQAQQHWARCAVEPRCDVNDPSRAPATHDPSQELLALLGGDKIDAFNKYRDSISERDAVAQFRGRLSDSSYLPEAQAEQLVAALAEERQRYSQEASQRGARLRGWGTNLGMIMYPDDIGSVEQQLAEAAQYSQRMQARAASILTPAQLAAYVQMQEELLAQMASYLRPAPRKASSLAVNAS
jgi:hypothetical protein